MKKFFKILLTVCIVTLLVAAFAVAANAYGEITYQEGVYSYTVSKGKATIVNTVRMLEGDVVIPSKLGGYPVVEIGHRAFKQEDEVTSFVIPETVTKMGNSAFQSCMYLESVTLPKSLTNIGEYAFYYCPNLNNVVIPDSVTEIGCYAFAGCWELTDITFGSGVTTLGEMAFYDCKGLTSIAIPDTITSFGYQMFGYCDNLEEVKLPANITEIPMETFTQCYKLTNVTMPKEITNISYSAFNSCEVLKKIEIPATVKTICDGAFNYCEGLKFVYYGGSEAQWNKITIEDGNEYLTNAAITYNYSAATAPIPLTDSLINYRLRCTTSVEKRTLTATASAEGVSSMKIRLGNLPYGATVELTAENESVSIDGAMITIKKPAVGTVWASMKITLEEGYVTSFTLIGDFDNPVRYMQRARLSQNGNNITFTSGAANCYIGFEGTLSVKSASRNMLGRYTVSGKYIRFYNPVYDSGEFVIEATEDDGTVTEYNVTVVFDTTEYSPLTSTLRATYAVSGDTVTVTADAGVTNVYLVIGKYYSETLSIEGADENENVYDENGNYLVKHVQSRGWRVYKSDSPVEFDMVYDASSAGGDAVTRHFIINF